MDTRGLNALLERAFEECTIGRARPVVSGSMVGGREHDGPEDGPSWHLAVGMLE